MDAYVYIQASLLLACVWAFNESLRTKAQVILMSKVTFQEL